MNRIAIALVLLALASCQATQQAPFRATYVNYTSSTYTAEEADGFDAIPGVEVGLMYGGSEESTPDRAVGVVGDIALRYGSGGDSYDGLDVDLDSLGIRTGLRYYFDTGTRKLQPFLGGGLLVQHTWMETSISGDEADETSAGFIGMVGLESQVSDHLRFNVGYSLTSGIEPSVDGEDIDLDSGALLFGVGWSF